MLVSARFVLSFIYVFNLGIAPLLIIVFIVIVITKRINPIAHVLFSHDVVRGNDLHIYIFKNISGQQK